MPDEQDNKGGQEGAAPPETGGGSSAQSAQGAESTWADTSPKADDQETASTASEKDASPSSGGNKTVALREERDRRRAAEREASELRKQIETLTKGTTTSELVPSIEGDLEKDEDLKRGLSEGDVKSFAVHAKKREQELVKKTIATVMGTMDARMRVERLGLEAERAVMSNEIFSDEAFGGLAKKMFMANFQAEFRKDPKAVDVERLAGDVAKELSQIKVKLGAPRIPDTQHHPPPSTGTADPTVLKPSSSVPKASEPNSIHELARGAMAKASAMFKKQ